MAAIARIFTIFALILVLGLSNAFVPANQPGFARTQTDLNFGFLKELGFEKPSWLPDFGGKKEEKKEPVAVTAEGESEQEAEPEVED